MAGSDKGYSCVYQTEDDNGEGARGRCLQGDEGRAAQASRGRSKPWLVHHPALSHLTHPPACPRTPPPLQTGDIGVRLSKDLTTVAAQALMTNLTRLGPLVLPPSEKLLFALNFIKEKIYGRDKSKPYVPNFKAAVKHICIHSGGRAVIDGMQKVLRMDDAETEPSRATLYKWGNVWGASVWGAPPPPPGPLPRRAAWPPAVPLPALFQSQALPAAALSHPCLRPHTHCWTTSNLTPPQSPLKPHSRP
jgi:hypothetical protein